MAVYVDDAFVAADWGRWTGGGHLQADTLEELHAFAARLGLRRAWFQSRPGRPDRDHYDLTREGRDAAIRAGAIPETARAGVIRRRALRPRVAPTAR
jgi:Ser/Thr protein kinase RdoA (MazF antagonist)